MTDNDDYRDSDVLARRQQAPNRTPSVPQIWWKVGCAPRQPTPSTRTTKAAARTPEKTCHLAHFGEQGMNVDVALEVINAATQPDKPPEPDWLF